MGLDQNIINIIINQFALQKYQTKDIDVSDFGLRDLELLLAQRIKYLIDYDRDKLMHSLYRIDIDEDRVKMIFKNSQSDMIPLRIARLIIDRTIKKIQWHQQINDIE